MSKRWQWGAGLGAFLAACGAQAFVITLTDSVGGANLQATTDVAPESSFYFANPLPTSIGVAYNIAGQGGALSAQVVGLTAPGSDRVLDLVVFQGFAVDLDTYHLDLRFLSSNEAGRFLAGNTDFGGPFDCVVGVGLGPNFNDAAFSACIPVTGDLQSVFSSDLFTIQGRFIASVDAPTTFGLLLAGLLGFGILRRRLPR